jgi:hypothetical protein
MTALNRHEMRELRNAIAHDCLSEIEHSTPELDDERLSYVTIQVDRQLWLAARDCPKPPFFTQEQITAVAMMKASKNDEA